jgi:hypothetical protein
MKRYTLMEQGDTALTECADGDYYLASEVDTRIAELEQLLKQREDQLRAVLDLQRTDH